MNFSLRRIGSRGESTIPGWSEDPHVVYVDQWASTNKVALTDVLLVKGVNNSTTAQAESTVAWLASNCRMISSLSLVPDSGYAYKALLFKGAGQQAYRIDVSHYDCQR